MPFGDMTHRDSFNSVESKLGVLEGLLRPLPGQIQELFAKFNDHVESQADKHATITAHSEELNTKIKNTCMGEGGCDAAKKVAELRTMVSSLKEFVDSSKESSSFIKKHLATLIVSIASAVMGSLITYVLLNILMGKGVI